MTRGVFLANLAGLLLAVALSLLPGMRDAPETSVEVPVSGTTSEAFPQRNTRGKPEMLDKSGVWLELLHYERIASGSTLADELLLEFCEPNRILSFTAFSQQNADRAHRYAGKPQLSALDDLEKLIALEPDLLLLNTLGSEKRVARLRELGIPVFDLGEMRGVDTYLDNARAVATLVGRPELGERYATGFRRRMERVTPARPEGQRMRAAYLSVFGTSTYGGGARTSYDDVLRYAGLDNVVARAHQGWPDLSVEEILGLDPEVIVTHLGMGEALCSLSELNRLSACRGARRSIIELPPSLLSDPGAGMLDTAEAIHAGAERLRAEGEL
jgi:iron complex transport system substrate-binding protein